MLIKDVTNVETAVSVLQEVVALPSRELPTTPTAILAVTDEQNFLTSLRNSKLIVKKEFFLPQPQ